MIQAVDKADFFLKRWNRKTACPSRKPPRPARLRLPGTPPLGQCQLPDLAEIKIDAVVPAVSTRPARKTDRDISEIVEMQIVKDDQDAVTRRNYVLLEKVGAHRVRHGLAGQRVLGQISRRAPMCDDQRPLVCHTSAHRALYSSPVTPSRFCISGLVVVYCRCTFLPGSMMALAAKAASAAS